MFRNGLYLGLRVLIYTTSLATGLDLVVALSGSFFFGGAVAITLLIILNGLLDLAYHGTQPHLSTPKVMAMVGLGVFGWDVFEKIGLVPNVHQGTANTLAVVGRLVFGAVLCILVRILIERIRITA